MSLTNSRNQAPSVETHGKYVGCCCPGAIGTAAKQLGWARKTSNVPSRQIVHLFRCCPEFRILAGRTMEKLLNRMNLEEYRKPWKTQRYHLLIGKSRWDESWGGNRTWQTSSQNHYQFLKICRGLRRQEILQNSRNVLIFGAMWNSSAQSWISIRVSEWGNFSQIVNVLGFFSLDLFFNKYHSKY